MCVLESTDCDEPKRSRAQNEMKHVVKILLPYFEYPRKKNQAHITEQVTVKTIF